MKTKDIKIRIVAIAKDELAYLPEWIFHHLYFGVDEIDVYINNTNDGSEKLVAALKTLSNVRFLDGDKYFRGAQRHPQIRIYEEALKQSKKDGITHLFYLDLDEYWVPADLKLTIKECCSDVGGDAVSFEWLIKKNENENFLPTISNELKGTRAQHVKTIFNVKLDIRAVNQHNVISDTCDYRLADGVVFEFDSNDFYKVPLHYLKRPLPQAFVLHRMHRSQMEYVSLLGRGRPVSEDKKTQFKDNRSGYMDSTFDTELYFNENNLAHYVDAREEFCGRYNLVPLIVEGQNYVESRFKKVLSDIASSGIEHAGLLAKLLKNVTLPEVLNVFDSFIYNHNLQYLTNQNAFLFEHSEFLAVRKAAFLLSTKHPALALNLLSILQRQRPDGKVINDKIEELKKCLSVKR